MVKDCKLSKTEAGTKECKLIVDEERKQGSGRLLPIYIFSRTSLSITIKHPPFLLNPLQFSEGPLWSEPLSPSMLDSMHNEISPPLSPIKGVHRILAFVAARYITPLTAPDQPETPLLMLIRQHSPTACVATGSEAGITT